MAKLGTAADRERQEDPEAGVEATMGTRYMYVWEYTVAPDRVDAFELAYGPSGEWVNLFGKAPGYIRTELHRDRGNPLRFITIDYWESEAAWKGFRSKFSEEFETLDARCAELTTGEREIGRFEPVG